MNSQKLFNNLSGTTQKLPDLPLTATTREGYIYCPGKNMWRLHDAGSEIWINFELYQPYCTDGFFHSLKLYMIHLLLNQALDTCSSFFRSSRKLVRYAYDRLNGEKVDIVTTQNMMDYRATLPREQEHHLHYIRPFLRKWGKYGYCGVESEALIALDEMKLKKTESGTAVRNHHPTKGPYNDEEFQAITLYLLDNFATGNIDIIDLSLGFLCMVFGARPVSFASLRIMDFDDSKDKFGICKYVLKIPAAKRGSGGRRTHLQDRKLTQEYGMMLQALVIKVKAHFAEQIEAGYDSLELPLFPGNNPDRGYSSSARTLYHRIQACFGAGDPILCNRKGLVGEPLKVNIKRFRHTVATRMAEEGKREREIAEALGHLWLKSSRVYIEANAKIRRKINEKLAQEINPIAQYFLGKIIYSEADAIRGDDPSSRIRGFQGQLKGAVLGNCGKSGFCGGFVPLPCYSCRKFQPWSDAPHEEVLRWLLLDRKNKYDATNDERYATVNDEIIKKVLDVTRRCKALRECNNIKEIIFE